jgi:acyl-CoA synthetase (AMP-forming)/AMP-acid ligase II
VIAFVVRPPGATATAEDLKHHCRELLAGYKVPKEIVLEDALPITNGNVQKATLRK